MALTETCERLCMGDALLPFPLTERSVHLCVDMQRIFSAEGPWPAPWMERVLPVVATLAGRHPERPPKAAHSDGFIRRSWNVAEESGSRTHQRPARGLPRI